MVSPMNATSDTTGGHRDSRFSGSSTTSADGGDTSVVPMVSDPHDAAESEIEGRGAGPRSPRAGLSRLQAWFSAAAPLVVTCAGRLCEIPSSVLLLSLSCGLRLLGGGGLEGM